MYIQSDKICMTADVVEQNTIVLHRLSTLFIEFYVMKSSWYFSSWRNIMEYCTQSYIVYLSPFSLVPCVKILILFIRYQKRRAINKISSQCTSATSLSIHQESSDTAILSGSLHTTIHFTGHGTVALMNIKSLPLVVFLDDRVV